MKIPLGFGFIELPASSSPKSTKPLALNARGIPDLNLVPQVEKYHLTVHALAKTTITENSHPQEHIVMDKYQLGPIDTTDLTLCLYDNGKGTLFPFFCLRNGKIVCQSEMPRYPMVYKHLHVKYLTYTYKDKESNKYTPYHMANDVSKAPKLESLVSESQLDSTKIKQGLQLQHNLTTIYFAKSKCYSTKGNPLGLNMCPMWN